MDKEYIKSLKCSLFDEESAAKIIKALNCKTRRDILRLLEKGPKGIWEIAEALNVPLSTISEHISVLTKAGIISVIRRVSDRGFAKIVCRQYEKIEIKIIQDSAEKNHEHTVAIQVPIGSYSAFSVGNYCGILSEEGYIGGRDNADSFYSPLRFAAQLIWFDCGYLEYTVPFTAETVKNAVSFSFSAEICSESPGYNENWKSDIFFDVNGVRVCTYTSPGDFGARRGVFTPSWWNDGTQYGFLVKVEVNATGTFLNGSMVSDTTLTDVRFFDSNVVVLRMGVDKSAKNKGGINLFGKKFGDYDKHIVVMVSDKAKTV